MRDLFARVGRDHGNGAAVRRLRRRTGHAIGRGSIVERLEPRRALAITVPVQDLTGLDPAEYDVWVTGHGIPGWQPAGQDPLYLMALGSTGSFTQVATAIESATSTGTTATITTMSPHGLKSGEQVFIAGVSPDGYDGVFTIAFESPTSFSITTSGSNLGDATPQQGTVYASSMIATRSISSATSLSFNAFQSTGLAEFTTSGPHGLSVGQAIEVTGMTPDGYNGVFSVAQVPSSTTFQVSYAAPAALADGAGGTLQSVALQPIRLSQLTGDITLDEGLTNVSSKLIVFVTSAGSSPSGLPFNANTVTPTDPPTAPYSPSLLAPGSVFDIVEFAYLPWGATTAEKDAKFEATITTTQPHGLKAGDSVTLSGVVDATGSAIAGYNSTFTVTSIASPLQFTFEVSSLLPDGGSGKAGSVSISSGFSTFDVSAVDGLTIPMTLTASEAKPSMVNGSLTTITSVGIRLESGFSRDAIGAAFTAFMQADPLGHVDAQNPASRDFTKLLYQSQVEGSPITGVSASWSNNTATFTYGSTSPILQYEWVEISGFTGSEVGFNGLFQVQTATDTDFTVTNTQSSLTTASGGTVTPVLFQGPSLPDSEFVAITAPKDWLANQVPSPTKTPPGLASQDPLATFWDETIESFFQSGNFVSIYLGKDPAYPIYSGSSDGTQFTLSNGPNTFQFPKPTGGSLANAMYVWSQENAPSGDAGLLQDQIWQALCRGVALDGVSASSVTNGESSTAWNDSTTWYTQHTSTAFPTFESVYDPYSKFLHYSTLQGTVDTTATTSIFLHNAAYGFGEDENPIGNPYNGPLVPSKLDGTVYDDSSVTISLAPWTTPPPPTIVSGDFNGDGLTDIASRDQATGMWSVALTAGDPTTPPTTVPMRAWSTKFTYDDIAVGDFTGDGVDDIVGRDTVGRWWLLADTGSGYTNTMIGRWSADVAWIDVVVGNFDGDPGNKADIAGRTPTGMWWYLHDSGTTTPQFVNEKMARWSVGTDAKPVAWSDIVVGDFDGVNDGRDEIAGRNSSGQWWLLSYDTTTSAWGNELLGGWATSQQWVDVVAGKFDDSGRTTIAGRTGSDVWWLLSYDTAKEQFTNTRMGRWAGSATAWGSVVVGDFDGNGVDDVAGRNLTSGSWNVTGLVNGTYTTRNFTSGGGEWPTSSAWALAFAGLYDTQAKGPPAMWGILGRSISGSWIRSLSDGTAFTTESVTGYP